MGTLTVITSLFAGYLVHAWEVNPGGHKVGWEQNGSHISTDWQESVAVPPISDVRADIVPIVAWCLRSRA